MVLTRPFRAPTEIYSDIGYQDAVPALIGGRRWVLVTSAGWRARGVVDRLIGAAGRPEAVIDDVRENPKFAQILDQSKAFPDCEMVVALGGGSVIDSAKALAALAALADEDILAAHLMSGEDLPDGFAPPPIVAVPTTSGAGSEVTRWATIWGDEKVKFSLSHAALYPAHAILDPRLCVSMPPALTLSSGLDALSHAMEAIWNRNHTDISDGCAVQAIALIRRWLPEVLADPADLRLRREMQKASLMAALAMGTTQTALAHSISYPFTAQFGMPHGFACSFTLPEVAGYNAQADPERVALAAEAFGCGLDEFPNALAAWLDGLGIGAHLDTYVTPAVTGTLGDSLITRARAANNLREVDRATAREIVHRSLVRFCVKAPVPVADPAFASCARGATPMVVWITGLSGAGKTTLCRAIVELVKPHLPELVVLDGDTVRAAFGHNLGHTEHDRIRQFRRLQSMARVLAQQGLAVLVGAVYSSEELFAWNRENLPGYFEVHIRAPLEFVVARDPKGLYAKALAGEVSDVVGIDIPWLEPTNPDIVIDAQACEPPIDLAYRVAQAVPRLAAALPGRVRRAAGE